MPKTILVSVCALVILIALASTVPAGRALEATTLQVPTLTPATSTAQVYLPYIRKSGTSPLDLTATPTQTQTLTLTPSPTRSPTSTLTPAPSPTPTATPTSTPVAEPIEVLPNHTHFTDDQGHLRILGEVRNNTANYLRSIQITAQLLRADGWPLDANVGHTKLSSIPPGDKACFDVLFWNPPPDWSDYELQATYRSGGAPPPNLTASNVAGTFEPTSGWYFITGRIRNDHGGRVEYVKPIGTLYDAAGNVVDCKFNYVDGLHLNNGQADDFELTYLDRNYALVDTYRLQIDGVAVESTVTPTATLEGQPTPTATRTPTSTASVTPTPTPTAPLSPTTMPAASPTPTATATLTLSPTATGTPTPSPTSASTTPATPTSTPAATLSPTGTPTPTATVAPANTLRITFVQYPSDDEYVRIENASDTARDLTGWSLLSVVGEERFNFPAGYVIGADAFVRVHSGPDAPSNPPFDLMWTSSYVWDDAGDRAELFDSEGNRVDSRCYKSGCN